jgi:hypothetical protein
MEKVDYDIVINKVENLQHDFRNFLEKANEVVILTFVADSNLGKELDLCLMGMEENLRMFSYFIDSLNKLKSETD